MLNLELDMQSFYRIAEAHPKFSRVIRSFGGLRPLRHASLFEMVVTAIMEQQIALRVSHVMHEKVAVRFGDLVNGIRVFPDEIGLANAHLSELLACGLSHRKAEHIRDLSKKVVPNHFDLERLKQMNADDVHADLTQIRGLGIRRLPVVDKEKLVGILTEADLLKLVLSHQNLILESVAESIPAATREQLRSITGHFELEKPPARMRDS